MYYAFLQKGFTLIELDDRCGDYCILVAIAIPQYSDYTSRSRGCGCCRGNCFCIKSAIAMRHQDLGNFYWVLCR